MSTTRYAALLQGINVGGNRKVPMADLRSLLGGLGFHDVATYVQSGNAAFTAGSADADAVTATVEAAIAEAFGFAVDVMLRNAAELSAVVSGNPFAALAEADPKRVHAAFVRAAPDAARVDAVRALGDGDEEIVVGDRVLYVSLPRGVAGSKLAAALTLRKLGTPVTTRNWRTVEAVAALAGP